MRFFLAIPLNQPVNDALDAWLQQAGLLHPVRVVPRENRHITIQFFGEIDEVLAAAIIRLVGEYCSTCVQGPSGGLEVAGIGFFPAEVTPKILWAGVRDKHGWLGEFAAGIATRLETLGVYRDSPAWRPHVTLARCPGMSAIRAAELCSHNTATGFGSILPVSVVAYQSILRPQGAVYTALSGHTPGA